LISILGFSFAESQRWQQMTPDRTQLELAPKSFRKFNFDRSHPFWCAMDSMG
jgi:hypothetical protein